MLWAHAMGVYILQEYMLWAYTIGVYVTLTPTAIISVGLLLIGAKAISHLGLQYCLTGANSIG